jgi:hypothetical protein
MDAIISIGKIINEILLSNTIDEKRLKRNQVMQLFKEADLVNVMPIVVKLNTALELQEAIDSYIVHDNNTAVDNLNNSFSNLKDLLLNDIKAA